ncbi:L-tyrosine/L-tryptophan isonitrile synthase family protein [Candidatus Gottesmanbacteria bacterium]|nr:L-tyrosine/L-tryptophan isonitrile synthase family protein [Candidatus Gottesmanbacteria bacterium]
MTGATKQNLEGNMYVYPFVPFADLTNKNFLDNFLVGPTLTEETVVNFVGTIAAPPPRIIGRTIEERVLDIFLDDQYRFGPREIVAAEAAGWQDRMRKFIQRQEPIRCIILGFPFKIPVLLKTNRCAPDLGEILVLNRLSAIGKLIKTVYPPGATIDIFTEGVFGKFSGVTVQEADAYRERLRYLVTVFGWESYFRLTDLGGLEAMIPNFEVTYQKNIEEFKTAYTAGQLEAVSRYEEIYPSIFRIVNSKMYSDDELMDAYNDNVDGHDLSAAALAARRDLGQRAREAVFCYHAYHQTRNDSGIMATVAPATLYLTVSPKPGRLGIFPIDKDIIRLPYHGVPVWHELTNRFSIEYLIDIRRQPGPYRQIFLAGDPDNQPFYYSI